MKRLEGRRARVVVAMSGGVDSSTVAGLLLEQGHEVIGVTMKLHDLSQDPAAQKVLEAGSEGTCCSLDDVSDARRVATHLDIPFYVGNYETAFQKAVVDEFVDAYVAGRTPNPCVKCNDVVKFRALLGRSKTLGADFLATGHYCRTELLDDGEVGLFEGLDTGKDQSYFMAGIPRRALDRVIFPLGGMHKSEVRAHAERMGLPVANKPESQEICFIPDHDYAGFVERHAGDRLAGPGKIIGLDGLSIGKHKGLHHYTVGQRRGLGIAAPEPRYVVALRPEDNALVVGVKADVMEIQLHANELRWLVDPPEVGTKVRARIRHNSAAAAATITELDPQGDGLSLRFDEPALAITPGQQLALYEADESGRVLGAATIDSTSMEKARSATGPAPQEAARA